MLIHNLGTDIDVHPSDSSELVAGIMQASTLTLHFKHNEVLNLHQGATVEFQGETFTLIYPEQIKKLFKGYYEYTITFHSTAERLKQKLLKDPSNVARTSFVFAGSASRPRTTRQLPFGRIPAGQRLDGLPKSSKRSGW